jgi:hypothetical protein
MCLQNQIKRPEVDRTTVWRGATGNETRRYGKGRPISWHEPNDTAALQTIEIAEIQLLLLLK